VRRALRETAGLAENEWIELTEPEPAGEIA
jgi:hypothetical protein